MRIFKVYRMTSTETGTLKSWEKTFSTVEECIEYVQRQKDLLINYEGLTLSAFSSCMAAFTLNGQLMVTLIIESTYINEKKKYKISYSILNTIDYIFCNNFTRDEDYLYNKDENGKYINKIPLKNIITIEKL